MSQATQVAMTNSLERDFWLFIPVDLFRFQCFATRHTLPHSLQRWVSSKGSSKAGSERADLRCRHSEDRSLHHGTWIELVYLCQQSHRHKHSSAQAAKCARKLKACCGAIIALLKATKC